MTDGSRLSHASQGSTWQDRAADAAPPTIGDLLRYLHARRVRLLTIFALLAAIGFAALLGWYLFGSRSAHGVIVLSFRGIEKHEYPSGKKFGVEDLRSPRILTRALEDLGVPEESRDLKAVYHGIDLVPLVPSSVRERWKKQDRDGAKREEYLPNEFALDVAPKGFDDAQRVRLLYALLAAYQQQIKFEQASELNRIARFSTVPAEQLVAVYDYWDVPILLRLHSETVGARLDELVHESENFRDPAMNLSFREIARDLQAWSITRLEALAALVHRERLVKDRDVMLNRLQERGANIDIELRQLSNEAAETAKLLEAVERPKPLLAGQLASRDNSPLIDSTALEKMVKNDYVGPVVRRASQLNELTARSNANKERVQREIDLLSKVGPDGIGKLPEEFEKLVVLSAKDLDRIVDSYLKVLDSYLDATVTSHITLSEGPYVKLRGPEVRVVAVAILFVAACLALLIVLTSDSLKGRGGKHG